MPIAVQGVTDAEGKKFIIRDLRITDAVVHYAILGGKGLDLELPDLRLTDIGGSAEGVATESLVLRLRQKLLALLPVRQARQ